MDFVWDFFWDSYLPGLLMLVGVPLYVLVMFGVALYRYIRICKQRQREPDSVKAGEVKSRLILLVIASIMLAMLVIFIAYLIWLASLPVPFM